MHLLRTHIRFVCLLCLFTLGVIGQMAVLPPAEASDEILHYTYVEWLRTEKRLPDRFSHEDNCTRQESGQPPLTYILGAVMLEGLNVPRVDCAVAMAYFNSIDNPWKTPMDGWNRVDNAISFLRVKNVTEFPQAAINHSITLLRLISIPFGIVAVIGAYGSALEIFKRQSLALLAAVIFAFMPMMVHVTAYWTNDITSIAFASLIVWSLLRLLRLGANSWRLIGLGLLFGLGGLCKVSVMLLLPAAGLAILLDWRRQRASFIRLIGNGFLVGLPILVLFVPWIVYGFTTFQDPVGFRTHTDPDFNYNPALTVSQTLPMMPEMYLTYIGKFGFSKMYLHPLTYTAIGVIFLLSVFGYLSAWVRRPSFSWIQDFWQNRRAQQALVLLVVTVVVFAGFYNWLRQIYFVSGRLMYSAHVPISLAITGGLYLLVRRWPRLKLMVQTYSVTVLGVAGLVLPSIVIYNAVMPPTMLTHDQLPALQGTPIDFDHTIRLLGYQQPNRVINEPIYSMNLCWEVLQTTTRPAAFSLKIIHDGVILADRTSIHGMGRYNSSLWQAEAIFCDEVDIRIDDPDVVVEPQPEPAQVYDILLIMLDAKTQEVDWQATTLDGQAVAYPIITQVVTAAGDMRDLADNPLTQSTVQISGFADLAGFSINGDLTAGAELSIDMLWHVSGTTSESWSQFIHLNGPNGAVGLADGVPRGGNYPTWGWSAGETVFDRWLVQLPDQLPSGDYELLIGFYQQSNGERIPITVDGTTAQDHAAILLHFTVP